MFLCKFVTREILKPDKTMFKDQPKGLFALALANTGERFGYYTMLAIFLLFIQAKFGFSAAVSTQI